MLPQNVKNLVGKVFGRLTVISYAGKLNGKHSWNCDCSCGNKKVAVGEYLSGGNTSSCGCYRAENSSELGKKRQGRKFGSVMLSNFLDDEDYY